MLGHHLHALAELGEHARLVLVPAVPEPALHLPHLPVQLLGQPIQVGEVRVLVERPGQERTEGMEIQERGGGWEERGGGEEGRRGEEDRGGGQGRKTGEEGGRAGEEEMRRGGQESEDKKKGEEKDRSGGEGKG